MLMNNINTIYTSNRVSDKLINQIKESVEINGICDVSFNVVGRTKHLLLSKELEKRLPEYNFNIDYDLYRCRISNDKINENEYEEYLKDNMDIIKFIKENRLEKEIVCADEEAKELIGNENKYLHSYRFSKIYDVISNRKLDKLNVFKILKIIENPFNKNIDELLEDGFSQIEEMEFCL